jgi:putative hemolysin
MDAMMDIEEVEELIPGISFGDEETRDDRTLAGFIVKHLDRIPGQVDSFKYHGAMFEILDMDRHRVDKVLVTPAEPVAPPPAEPAND